MRRLHTPPKHTISRPRFVWQCPFPGTRPKGLQPGGINRAPLPLEWLARLPLWLDAGWQRRYHLPSHDTRSTKQVTFPEGRSFRPLRNSPRRSRSGNLPAGPPPGARPPGTGLQRSKTHLLPPRQNQNIPEGGGRGGRNSVPARSTAAWMRRKGVRSCRRMRKRPSFVP